jgi:hypothetical protein
MAEKKQRGAIVRLSEALTKVTEHVAPVSRSSDVDVDNDEEPGGGPEDRPIDREKIEIVPLPHLG